MEAYIDLSYIFHLLLYISSVNLSNMLSSTKIKRKHLIVLEITSLFLYFNVLLFAKKAIYFNIIYYLIMFYLFFKNNFFFVLFSFVFSYYSQIAIIRIFTNDIYLYKGILMIYNPKGVIYILMCPLITLIINIITRSIKSLMFLRKYRYNVRLDIHNKIYNTSAYFDSGNTMKFKDLPVVFLTEELKDKNVSYERILVEGIGKECSDYLKGKIYFEDKEKEVYFAYVKKRSFNGCKCLLNVYLLG